MYFKSSVFHNRGGRTITPSIRDSFGWSRWNQHVTWIITNSVRAVVDSIKHDRTMHQHLKVYLCRLRTPAAPTVQPRISVPHGVLFQKLEYSPSSAGKKIGLQVGDKNRTLSQSQSLAVMEGVPVAVLW